MPRDFLHNHPQFEDLIRIVAEEKGINPALVEKDYWIMHCLYGLQQMGLRFELKGGTSLSKGFQMIDRFSEDIDVRIDPEPGHDVKTNKNHTKDAHVQTRAAFYDGLAAKISIDGIERVTRDHEFDNDKLFSAGIRLIYPNAMTPIADLRDGVLLEAGFAKVTPNEPKDITSWTYDYAAPRVDIIDNRATNVRCYNPGFTLVEKLQTISTKYRKQQASGEVPVDFMRHYYDVYCLLKQHAVQTFIGTAAYKQHKADHFPAADNKNIRTNPAFNIQDPTTRKLYTDAYDVGKALYYKGRPTFGEILATLKVWREVL